MYKGIFWYVNDEIFSIKIECNADGITDNNVIYSSKSGDNFNHQTEWKKLNRKEPYNYYPRGRVEIKNKKAVVYLSTYLCTNPIKEKIIGVFELNDIKTQFKADGSDHYVSILYEGE